MSTMRVDLNRTSIVDDNNKNIKNIFSVQNVSSITCVIERNRLKGRDRKIIKDNFVAET